MRKKQVDFGHLPRNEHLVYDRTYFLIELRLIGKSSLEGSTALAGMGVVSKDYQA
ncbi:MAG: hypothetical protein MK198_12005 [Gracilimonas sp.]|nr:hypothetical protein [Gracilimonas sp.]